MGSTRVRSSVPWESGTNAETRHFVFQTSTYSHFIVWGSRSLLVRDHTLHIIQSQELYSLNEGYKLTAGLRRALAPLRTQRSASVPQRLEVLTDQCQSGAKQQRRRLLLVLLRAALH